MSWESQINEAWSHYVDKHEALNNDLAQDWAEADELSDYSEAAFDYMTGQKEALGDLIDEVKDALDGQ